MLTYQKLGENVAVLAPREGQRGRLIEGIGSDWTEAIIGMYFTGVDAHDENIAGPDETRTVIDASDYLTFGLKNSSTYDLPGFAGGFFIGIRSTGATSKCLAPSGGIGFFADTSESCSAVGYSGSTLVNGGVVSSSSLRFPDPNPETAFSGFYAVKLVVSNRGMSTQSVAVSVARSSQVSGTDYSKSALNQACRNATFGTAGLVAWNTGAAARTLPDSAWVRLPFFNNRIRIQEIIAIKISP